MELILTCGAFAGAWLLAMVLIALIAPKLAAGTKLQGTTALNVTAVQLLQGNAATATQTIGQSPQNQIALAYGTASGQSNILIYATVTINASSSLTININTGAVDIFGATAATMLHLKYIGIFITSGGDVNGLLIDGSASNPFLGYGIAGTTGPIIYPNGTGFQAGEPTVGITVSSGAANIKLTNESSAVAIVVTYCFMGTTT
jgi:hypothetical protein